MKKMVYIAESHRINGDSFIDAITFDLDEALKAVDDGIRYLTEGERKNTHHDISGYEIEVEDGQTAKEAYNEWLDEGDCMDYYQPDFYRFVG